MKLPNGVDVKLECKMSILRVLLMGEFIKYKREIEGHEVDDRIDEKKRKTRNGET